MESSKVMAVATEIRDQLVVLTNRNILLSWGIEGYKAVIYNEMHSLQIKVNGRLFQGNVLIMKYTFLITKKLVVFAIWHTSIC